MSSSEMPKAPEQPARLEQGVPKALIYMLIPALVLLVWAMFFKQ